MSKRVFIITHHNAVMDEAFSSLDKAKQAIQDLRLANSQLNAETLIPEFLDWKYESVMVHKARNWKIIEAIYRV